ncbi:MAG: DNA repair protein RecO [Candidatus Levybacteria bacterium]|nr:DNA repair protein RecO [Candidatus Levybacteria bacterium]
MHNLKTEAIIIKRKDSGEADRLLTVFTKGNGKMKIKAKGVRKISSRRGGHVELLNTSILSLYNGGKMPILTEAVTLRAFSPEKNGLEKIGAAFHLCELIDGLCAEHQENQRVYALIKRTIEELENTEEIDSLLNQFERDLLDLLGFWPKEKYLDPQDSQYVIEDILERKLRSKKILAAIL